MNVSSASSPAFFQSPQATNGANSAARDKKVATEAESDASTTDQTKPVNPLQKSPEEEKIIKELRITDQQVRAHELAHLAAAGGLSKGGATFEFQRGPDGQQYAVSGEVQIDTSGVPGDPEATLQKAQQIQRAALAPAQPSSQDRSVAVAAAAMAAEARAEIASQSSNDDKSIDGEKTESSLQRIEAKVNDAYSPTTDTDSQRVAALVDLTV